MILLRRPTAEASKILRLQVTTPEAELVAMPLPRPMAAERAAEGSHHRRQLATAVAAEAKYHHHRLSTTQEAEISVIRLRRLAEEAETPPILLRRLATEAASTIPLGPRAETPGILLRPRVATAAATPLILIHRLTTAMVEEEA
ncbi:hypothetical protein [Streptomyces dysideae]|uniref:Uncharacterized protein n=1 Tax=Streptomyces dysideae TaxID=909626 RepID=A0A101V3Z8_9ACTN|nr:hypothetical protein [Streptomyces dysideae]KUO22065.1 hypothetical protein AQJ91_05620 [Streptomyces dysideae]